MNLSLNPKAFDRPLRFEWFTSEEGETWQLALESLLIGLGLKRYELILTMNYVAQTLNRIGKEKLRRHFEIRPIAIGEEHSLVELRWSPGHIDRGLSLRLYAYVDFEAACLVGLCFRQKVVGASPAETTQLQNIDISRAIDLAKRHRSSLRGG